MAIDRDRVRKDFAAAVNMTADELREWLESEQSRGVGLVRPGETESVGHASGRRIVALLGQRETRLTDDDYAHMRLVVGYIARHCAQRPANIVTSRWRYSLMNWGHDPLKEL